MLSIDAIHERVFSQFGNFAAVRDLNWHYFQHTEGENRGRGPCLYDLAKDPAETVNAYKQHPEVVRQMRGALEERLGVLLPE
jgi:hypothetical protein